MPLDDCHATCHPCEGNPFRYIDWTQSPTPFDTITPCPSKLVDEVKTPDERTKQTLPKLVSPEDEDKLAVENVPLKFEDLGLEDDFPEESKDPLRTHLWEHEIDSELEGPLEEEPEDQNKTDALWGNEQTKDEKRKWWWQRLLGSPRKDARQKGSLWTDEHTSGPDTERRLQDVPKDSTLGEQSDSSGLQRKTPPERILKDEQRLSSGAQGDTLDQPKEVQSDTQALSESAQKDTQALSEGAQGDAQAQKRIEERKTDAERKKERLAQRKKHRRDRRRDRKKRAKKKKNAIPVQEITEAKPAKELTLLDEEPISPGDLDAVTKRQYEIDEMWYRVQTGRFIPQPTRPLAPHWRWHTTLKIKHYIQKVLNPLDTLRSGIYAKDMHGPLRGSVSWRGSAGARAGWGCGCPALPCICHLHTMKPAKKMPRGARAWSRGSPASRLMERVEMRVRIEERLHQKLADLPPPHDQATEPLFCLGVDKCVARQVMTKPLIEAAERTRQEAMERFPCDPDCKARCIIAYVDTVKMLRLQAAAEVLGSNYVQVAKTRGPGTTNVKFTSKRKDMEFIREKCAEIKGEVPFPTKAICYRVEEVRGVAGAISSSGESSESSSGASAGEFAPRAPAPAPAPARRHTAPHVEEAVASKGNATTPTTRAPASRASLRPCDHINNNHIIFSTNNIFKGYSRQQTINKNGKEYTKKKKLERAITITGTKASAREALNPTGIASGLGGDAESQRRARVTLSPKALTLRKDATQSTTEISSSRISKNREMNRRKTTWEHYRDNFRNLRIALKDALKTLAPGSNIWKFNNLKYWLACCWLSPKSNSVVCSDFQEELYPHLAKLIQDEERYRNILMLKNYLVNRNIK